MPALVRDAEDAVHTGYRVLFARDSKGPHSARGDAKRRAAEWVT